MLTSPLKPTLKRYWKIFFTKKKISIQRALLYEALEEIKISGRILDFGGGKKANYFNQFHRWMKDGTYESANISKEIEPSYLISVDGKIPVKKETFDVVFSLNTFEHIYDNKNTLIELRRVLKKGGIFVFSTPFLYRVHASPNDYIRPTASWWGEILNELGMTDIRIKPLVWDPITSAFSICDGILPFSFILRKIIPIYGLIYSLFKSKKGSKHYPINVGNQLANFAVGYLILAKKNNIKN